MASITSFMLIGAAAATGGSGAGAGAGAWTGGVILPPPPSAAAISSTLSIMLSGMPAFRAFRLRQVESGV